MSANAVDLFAGVNVAPPTGAGQLLSATGAGTAAWANPAAGGALTGTLPNPGLAAASVVSALAGQTVAVGDLDVTTADVDVSTAGQGLQIAEGANAKQGTFALSGAATTVVANTSVTANSRILLTCQALGTVAAASTLAVSARSAGVSFTVTPSQATDTSTIAFEIFEPG